MARNRAPMLLQALCSGALEPRRASQYSARPPESALKKTPDLKPDHNANLSRHWLAPRHTESKPESTPNRLFSDSRAGVFWFFFALAQLLLTAIKLTDWMIFTAVKKDATPERQFQKNVEQPTLGATE
jgi:hypothetical protein